MSDLETASKTATWVLDEMRSAEGMAVQGTQAHWQFCSAALMQRWPRIKFCLEVLEKQYEHGKAQISDPQ